MIFSKGEQTRWKNSRVHNGPLETLFVLIRIYYMLKKQNKCEDPDDNRSDEAHRGRLLTQS